MYSSKQTHLDRFIGFYIVGFSVLVVAVIIAIVLVASNGSDGSQYSSAADFANQQCKTHGGVLSFKDSDEWNYVTGVCADKTAISGEW